MHFGMVNLVVRELYTREEAAEVLSISERTLYELERSCEVDVVRIGRAVRITRESILRYIETLSEEAQSEKLNKRVLDFIKRSASESIPKLQDLKSRCPELADECDELLESARTNLKWAINNGQC